MGRYARLYRWRSIYFIQNEAEYPDGPCKVGRANDVAKRLSTLQIGSSEPMGLAECLFLHCSEKALSVIEAQMHVALKENGLHMRGEWFSGGIEAVYGIAMKRLMEIGGGIEMRNLREMRRHMRLEERHQDSWNDRIRGHDHPAETFDGLTNCTFVDS